MIVIACPGQGSQTPGFLGPWFDVPGNRERVEALGNAIAVDLVAHGTTSDADTIRDTAVAQPLIVAAGIMSAATLRSQLGDFSLGGVAGHSVGEITAAAVAGVLTEAEAMQFVHERGTRMAWAAAQQPTGMSAVVGGAEDDVLAALSEFGLSPANYNGGGQIVAAGSMAALSALKERPPVGARVIPLQVAGAFHTKAMRAAVDPLAEFATRLAPRDPELPLWTNADGTLVPSGARFVELLVGQVSSPVRWDLCMAGMAAAGVTGIIELTPAGALAGLAKRALKGIPVVALKTPDDVPAAVELCRADASS